MNPVEHSARCLFAKAHPECAGNPDTHPAWRTMLAEIGGGIPSEDFITADWRRVYAAIRAGMVTEGNAGVISSADVSLPPGISPEDAAHLQFVERPECERRRDGIDIEDDDALAFNPRTGKAYDYRTGRWRNWPPAGCAPDPSTRDARRGG